MRRLCSLSGLKRIEPSKDRLGPLGKYGLNLSERKSALNDGFGRSVGLFIKFAASGELPDALAPGYIASTP